MDERTKELHLTAAGIELAIAREAAYTASTREMLTLVDDANSDKVRNELDKSEARLVQLRMAHMHSRDALTALSLGIKDAVFDHVSAARRHLTKAESI